MQNRPMETFDLETKYPYFMVNEYVKMDMQTRCVFSFYQAYKEMQTISYQKKVDESVSVLYNGINGDIDSIMEDIDYWGLDINFSLKVIVALVKRNKVIPHTKTIKEKDAVLFIENLFF